MARRNVFPSALETIAGPIAGAISPGEIEVGGPGTSGQLLLGTPRGQRRGILTGQQLEQADILKKTKKPGFWGKRGGKLLGSILSILGTAGLGAGLGALSGGRAGAGRGATIGGTMMTLLDLAQRQAAAAAPATEAARRQKERLVQLQMTPLSYRQHILAQQDPEYAKILAAERIKPKKPTKPEKVNKDVIKGKAASLIEWAEGGSVGPPPVQFTKQEALIFRGMPEYGMFKAQYEATLPE